MTHQFITQAALTDTWLKTPGQWRLVAMGQGANVEHCVRLSCPDCGEVADLQEHTVNQAGCVDPSVVCPNKECNFHKYIFLKGWTGCLN